MKVWGSFIPFYEKIPHAQKSQKEQKASKVTFFILEVFMRKKSTESTSRQTTGFLLLDVFYAHKNVVFFIFIRFCAFCAFYAKQATFFILDDFMPTKSTKSTRRQTSGFFLLDVFYAHKNAAFFIFIRLCAFCAFCACMIFS